MIVTKQTNQTFIEVASQSNQTKMIMQSGAIFLDPLDVHRKELGIFSIYRILGFEHVTVEIKKYRSRDPDTPRKEHNYQIRFWKRV